MRSLAMVSLALFLIGYSGTALADPPAMPSLDAYVRAARSFALEDQVARSTLDEREAQRDQAILALVPKATITGTYTRNQYESVIQLPQPGGTTRTVTITPYDQLEADARLDATLVDIAAIRRVGAATARRDSARAQSKESSNQTERSVATAYYQLISAQGVLRAAKTALATAEADEKVIEVRQNADLASELDLQRAKAEVDAQRGNVATAERGSALAARKLRSLTGLAVDGAAPPLDVSLDAPPPLTTYLGHSEETPSVRAARLDAEAAGTTAQSSWLVLAPRITASATERFTNAVGFGTSPAWAVGVAAQWSLDPLAIGTARVDHAASATAHLRAEQATRDARDGIEDAWRDVAAKRDAAEAARSQEEATKLAVKVAEAKRDAGKATELDVLIAKRDAFQAEVLRVEADSDLELARRVLEIASRGGSQ